MIVEETMKHSHRRVIPIFLGLSALIALTIAKPAAFAQELPLHHTFQEPKDAPIDEPVVLQIGNSSGDGSSEEPSAWITLRRGLEVEVVSKFKTNELGQTSADLKFTLDLNPIRDALIQSRFLERDNLNVGTYSVDVALMAATEAIAGVVEYLILKESGKDTTWNGARRFYETVGERGLNSFGWQGVDWRDGNFGTWQNTLHGVPFYFASTFFRARGYSPLLSALGGVITGLVIHETIAECWEQPKSGHDFVMNTLSALAGAIPGMGQEIQISALTGQPTSRFYVEDKSLGRIFFAFEQIRDFKGTYPVDQIPIRPWNFQLGFEVFASDAISVGPQLNLLTDDKELNDFWRTFQLSRSSIGLAVKLRVP